MKIVYGKLALYAFLASIISGNDAKDTCALVKSILSEGENCIPFTISCHFYPAIVYCFGNVVMVNN